MAGSEALLASQINGGGCLAPPTPAERPADVMAKTLNAFFGGDTRTNYDKYNQELEPSLAFRTSTLTSMVSGVGGFIDGKNMQAAERPRGKQLRHLRPFRRLLQPSISFL